MEITTRLVGCQYHPAFQDLYCAYYLGEDTTLRLEAEPDNPYDPLAVKVLWQGMQVGYLPALNSDFHAGEEDEEVVNAFTRSDLMDELDHWRAELAGGEVQMLILRKGQ